MEFTVSDNLLSGKVIGWTGAYDEDITDDDKLVYSIHTTDPVRVDYKTGEKTNARVAATTKKHYNRTT